MKTQSHRVILPAFLALLLVAGCGGGGGGRKGPRGYAPQPSKAPPPVPPVRDEPLDPQLRAAAQAVVDKALQDPEARLRANALEVLRDVAGQQRATEMVAALEDPQAGVRGAAALAVGDLQIAAAQPALLRLVRDQDANVRVAARYALHRLGNTRYSHDLEKTARDPDPAVRGTTAMVLGLLRERSALKILRVLRRDPNAAVRQQALEAMWRLGDEAGLKELVGFTASRYADDQMFALLALAAPRDQKLRDHITGYLTNEYHREVSLTAALALGMLDSDRGYAVAIDGAKSSDPIHRFLAARALGFIGRPDSQSTLRQLMQSDDRRVRLAAAAAVLQLKKVA